MLSLTLAEIASAVGGTLSEVDDPSARLSGLTATVHQQAAPNGIFEACAPAPASQDESRRDTGPVACKLARKPGGGPAIIVDDVLGAVGKLAALVLSHLHDLRVVGLTGSSGKTSTKDLLCQVLSQLGPTIATSGSFNGDIGVPLTALRADDNTKFLVLEMGTRRAGYIANLASLVKPAVGIVTNVGTAHIGFHGSRANIALAKGELIEVLPSSADGGVAVLNADDPLVMGMAARTAATVISYGRSEQAVVRAVDVRLAAGRASFRLVLPSGAASVRLRPLGAHQVMNALAVAAAAHALGMDIEAIADALSAADLLSAGRLEEVQCPDDITVLNDAFNANPESMCAGLRTLAAMASGRRMIAVLGDMKELGDYATAEHERIGRLAAELGVDVLVALGTEGANVIATAARTCGTVMAVQVADDLAQVRALLDREKKSGDIVLLKAPHRFGLDEIASTWAGT